VPAAWHHRPPRPPKSLTSPGDRPRREGRGPGDRQPSPHVSPERSKPASGSSRVRAVIYQGLPPGAYRRKTVHMTQPRMAILGFR
jgi:hypothetical protein